ncbi:hypothetical protein F5B18DRAFT_626940 [Nemania serpens]|nr:hypothetical protein F5B18DRAFT_626940 [Nemania serpens]
MLQYFTNKVKKHPEEKAVADKDEPKQSTSDIAKEETSAGAETKADPAATPIPQIISQPPVDDDDDDDDDDATEGTPVLDHEDEKFLEHLTSSHSSLGATHDDDDDTPPALPPRVKTPVMDIDSDASSVLSKEAGEGVGSKGKGKEKEGGQHEGEKEKEKDKKPSDRFKRFTSATNSFATNFPRSISFRRKPVPNSQSESTSASASALEPNTLAVPSPPEAVHETSDLARILDDLNLSARNNRAVSLSSESAAMARRFTQVLKDLTNGVPTAYGDLIALLEDRDGLLARNFEKLPSGLKRLVAQLPEKLTTSLAPELLAAAAEAQGLHAASHLEEAGEHGLKGAAAKYFSPASLHDLVTKPGAIAGLLRGIVNALKTRFPAFVGTNVLWSLAVFLLLSMLWYCYKRGREVRLEREAAEEGEKGNADGEKADVEKGDGGKEDGEKVDVDGGIEGPRVEELPDDPMLAAPSPQVVHEGEAGSKS